MEKALDTALEAGLSHEGLGWTFSEELRTSVHSEHLHMAPVLPICSQEGSKAATCTVVVSHTPLHGCRTTFTWRCLCSQCPVPTLRPPGRRMGSSVSKRCLHSPQMAAIAHVLARGARPASPSRPGVSRAGSQHGEETAPCSARSEQRGCKQGMAVG